MNAPELPSEIRLAAAMERHFGDPEADAHLRRPELWTVPLLKSFREDGEPGDLLPWPKTHSRVRLRPGEVTLWAGINGSGKSALTSQVALDLRHQGRRVVVASFEMKPWRTLKRMARQAAGNPLPSEAFLVGFVDWLGAGRLMLYDQAGRADWRIIAKTIRYAAVELGAQHFIADNLAMMVPGEDDYSQQKDAVTEFCAVARDTGCHVHLVAHVRKLKDDREIPSKFDVKGTGSITDQADNVFVLWRNRAKETARANAERGGAEFDDGAEPDAVIVVDKQRNGEWEGRVRLWYDQPSMSYRAVAARPPFLGYDIPCARAPREPGADEQE